MPVFRIFVKYGILLFFQLLFNGLFQRRQTGSVQALRNFSEGPELEVQDFRKIVFYRPADHKTMLPPSGRGSEEKRSGHFLPIQSGGGHETLFPESRRPGDP